MTDLYPVSFPNFENQFPLWDGSFGNPGCDICGTYDADIKAGGTYYCMTCLNHIRGYEGMSKVERTSGFLL